MYCRSCGAQLPEGARFCLKCGTPQDSTAQSEPFVPRQYAPAPPPPVEYNAPYEPPKSAEPAAAENSAATKGLVFGILAFCFISILFIVYRRVLFPMTYSGASLSRMAGPFIVFLLMDLLSLVFIILNAVFGIMGMVRGIVKKKNLALGIVAAALFVVNFIFFMVVAARVSYLSNAVTNYWLNQIYW
ncbi:MAG: zinc ribbon domain-containing protein [Clostridia bacterium]|nr:zinc ribbon domain-containing protein [Clostridia bacterium]